MRNPRIYHEGVSDWYIQPSNITHYMNLSYNTLSHMFTFINYLKQGGGGYATINVCPCVSFGYL